MDYLKDAQKAHEMAKSMVANGLAMNINDALKALQGMSETQQQSVKQEVKMEDNKYEERLAKIENFLQRFDKFFSKFYEDTTKRFNDLNKELNEMRDKMAQPVRSMNSMNREVERSVEQPKPSNQRVGAFTPADVDINDIFSNAGNKMMRR